MKEIVKFPINTPIEVALRFEGGKHVEGRCGDQVMYSLLDNRIMYVPPYVEQRIQELAIGAGEPLLLCKKEVEEGHRKWIEWSVKRAPQQPHPSANVTVAAETAQSKAPNDGNGKHERQRQRGHAQDQPYRGAGLGNGQRHEDDGSGPERRRRDRPARRGPSRRQELRLAVLQRGHPCDRTHHVHSSHAGRGCPMGAVANPTSRLTWQFFSKIGSQQLAEIRDRVDVVLEDWARQLTLFAPAAPLAPAQPMHLVPAPVVAAPVVEPELATILFT